MVPATANRRAVKRVHSGFTAPMRSDSPEQIAAIMHAKWDLGLEGGLSIANPIPTQDEIPADHIAAIIDQALADMAAKSITGKDTTPYLLARIADITGGDSLRANIALVKNNAHLGARIALAYAALGQTDSGDSE